MALIIASACTRKETNPLLTDYGTPFDVPPFEKIQPEHFMPAFLKGFEEQNLIIEKIVNNEEAPTFENTIKELDYSDDLLTKVSRAFGPFNSANTNDAIQAINRELAPISAKHNDDINLNEKLFARVKTLYEARETLGLNTEELRVLENTYKGFVRGGADLSSEDKDKLRAINSELSSLSVKFGENLLAETNDFKLVLENEEELAGLPDGVKAQAKSTATKMDMDGKYVFTLQTPSMVPFLQSSDRRELRQKLFTAYFMRGNNNNEHDNKEVVANIARLRVEKAKLLGYNSHADFVLERNMAKNPEKVLSFLAEIWEAALPVAKEEAKEQQKIIDKEGGNFKLESWDWWYYTEKIMKEKYELDEQAIRPYFALDNAIEGIFYVANRLYDLNFTPRNDLPKYHPEVLSYEVTRNGDHVGILFIDPYPRASKRGGAWCTAFRSQHRDKDGNNITPLVSMVTNFTPPAGDKPSLLSPDEVSTLFHEFGHALHQLLSNSTFPSVSGTSVSRDFVELPSQIMEHWAMEPEVLKVYAKHYQTGEIIPQQLIDKLDAASKFNMGFITIEYLAASLLDMEYHSLTEPVTLDVEKFESEKMNKYGLIDEIKPRYRSTYFNHIWASGYSAGYYSYIWCEVLDSDAFQAFVETGDIFNKDVATAFEKEILARGGSRDALESWLAFRGKEPGIDALLKNRGLK